MKILKDTLIFLLPVWSLFSCSKNGGLMEIPPKPEESILYVSIAPENGRTKASGSGHGIQEDDNTVEYLEIFIFRNEGEDAGSLESYKKFEGRELSGLKDLEVKATTGAKVIYAVANSHRSDWKGITTLSRFRTVESSLLSENLKSFVMTGYIETTLQVKTSLTLSVSRLVARVRLASLKTDFAGTPYEGMALTDVKVYLLNARENILYHDGGVPSASRILNHKKVVEGDVNGCAMTGMLYDGVPEDVTDAGHHTDHYFYCYENSIASETESDRFTRLVIQGNLNGHTYYYPVDINREGFGYDPSNSHSGILRNTGYTVNVTILRPGSTDPDRPVEHGTMVTTLNVLDWETVPTVNVEF